VEDNTISPSGGAPLGGGAGIWLGFAVNSLVRNNLISGNRAPGFAGIRLSEDRAEGVEPDYAGLPSGNCLVKNRIYANTTGVEVLADGGSNRWEGNLLSGNAGGNQQP
jgi:hypothetical protein